MTRAHSPELVAETDLTIARGATGLLQQFNRCAVLGLADVHTAVAVSRIGGEADEQVQLALALAVRALRLGSVAVDLHTVAASVFDESEEEIDISGLPWPAAEDWLDRCRQSPLVTEGPASPGTRPLRLVSGLLYLERYWQQEEVVRHQLQRRAAAEPPEQDLGRLRAALDRLFDGAGPAAGEIDRQRLASAVSALSWATVVAGGPGTGKTTTVARLLALLCDQPGPLPRIALAAPTGKAAARLEEAVRTAAGHLDPSDQERLGQVSASTLHRLLGWSPVSRSRFRHNSSHHLPYDVVVVDEMSMVSLTMMARLLEAVRPTARLVLVGDPDQLSSVEAGAVLADITQAAGSASPALVGGLRELDRITTGTQVGPDGGEAPATPSTGVVRLEHTWRYSGAIDQLARAIRASDADAVVAVLRG